jgi:hypothetical protein
MVDVLLVGVLFFFSSAIFGPSFVLFMGLVLVFSMDVCLSPSAAFATRQRAVFGVVLNVKSCRWLVLVQC